MSRTMLSADTPVQPGDLVFHLDSRGRIVHWNDEAARTFGYEPGEAVGLPFSVVSPLRTAGGDRSRFNIREIVAGRDFAGGFVCRRKDGAALALYVYATAGRDPAGRPMGVVCVGREVTDFWRAEQATIASEEKCRLLFSMSADPVVFTTPKGRILEANDATCRLAGYAPQEMVGMSVFDFVPEEKRLSVEATLAEFWRTKRVRAVIEFRSRTGTRVSLDVSAQARKLGGETVVVAICRDVTESLRAERAVRESEEKYRKIFASVRDGLFLESLDGRILAVNDGACQMLGYSQAELLRKRIEDLVPEETREWLPRIREALLKEKTFSGEGVNVRKDGRQIPVELSCSLVDLADEPFALVLVRDVSGRRRAEAALCESEVRYRTALNSMWGAAHVVDRELRILLVNTALDRYLSRLRLRTDVVGLKLTEAFPFLSPGVVAEYRQVFETGEPVVTEERTVIGGQGFVTDTRKTPVFEGKQVSRVLTVIHDITGRKRAEEELRESQRELATLMSNLPGMAYRCRNEPDWPLEFVSDGCVRLTGYRPADFIEGRVTYGELIHRHDRDFVWEEVQAALAARQPFELTYRIRTADGAEKWVWEQGRGMFDGSGGTVRLEGLVVDVTDRKRAEEELRASQERYSALFRGAPIGIYRTAPDGRILMANPALVEMLGYSSAEELTSRNLEKAGFEPGYSRDEFKRRLEEGDEIVGLEAVWTKADGKAICVRENARAVRGPDNRVVYYEGTVEDVTTKRRAEEELQASEDRFRRLVELSPDGIAVHQDGELVLVNPVGARVLGYGDPEEMVGLPVLDFVHPDDRARVVERIRSVLAEGKAGPLVEERFVRKDGSYVWVEVVNSPFVWQGRPAVQVVARDVSERRRLREEAEELATHMQAVFDNSPYGIGAECDGRVAYANRAFALLHGYGEPSDVVGRQVSELVAKEDRARVARYTEERAHDHEAPTRYRYRGLCKDGTSVVLDVVVAVYGVHGKTYTLGTVQRATPEQPEATLTT